MSPRVAEGVRNRLRRLESVWVSSNAGVRGAGTDVRRFATDVEGAKYSGLMEAAFTLSSITWALSSPFTAGPALLARGRAAVARILDALYRRSAVLVAGLAAEEAAQEAAQQLLVHLIQMTEGNRGSVDWREVGLNAAFGGGAGLVAGGLPWAALRWFARAGPVVRSAVVEALTELLVGLVTAPLSGGLAGLWAGVVNGLFSGGAESQAEVWGRRLRGARHVVDGSGRDVPEVDVPEPPVVVSPVDEALRELGIRRALDLPGVDLDRVLFELRADGPVIGRYRGRQVVLSWRCPTASAVGHRQDIPACGLPDTAVSASPCTSPRWSCSPPGCHAP